MKRKIKDREEILEIIRGLRAEGKSIVTINGSFDLFHYGHSLVMDEAKRQGDVLVVGVNSDESVKGWKRKIGYKDWMNRPINPESARAGIIASLESVDYVTVLDETERSTFVENIKPDVHVNGGEYGKECMESSMVKKYGGRIHIFEKSGDYSSSKLIKDIINAYHDP